VELAVLLALGQALGGSGTEPLRLRDANVTVLPAEALAPGRAGEVSLTILDLPERGLPIQLWLDADEVGLPDDRLGWDDVVDPQAVQPRLRARIVAPTRPGTHEVRGFVAYVTCNARRCRPRMREVTWSLTVEAPPTGR
jgi:hypothetical protein